MVIKKSHKYKVGEEVNGLKIIKKSKKKGIKTYEVQSLVYKDAPCFEVYEHNLDKGKGDPYISGHRVYEKNSLYSIDWVRPYLTDIEEAKNTSVKSGKKILLSCPICGRKKYMIVSHLTDRGFNCNVCSKNISYPEKFLSIYLEVKEIDYEYQKKFIELPKRRFDFYLPEWNLVIETHGLQHYNSVGFMNFEETNKSDEQKREFCKRNSITLVEIDCRKSEFDFIKANINMSILPSIKEKEGDIICNKLIETFFYYDTNKIIEMYDSGFSILAISRKMNISRTVTTNILKKTGNPIKQKLLLDDPNIIEDIKRIYVNEHGSILSISKTYNVSRTTIRNILIRQGVDIKKDYRYAVKIRCVNNGKVFSSVKEASEWCNVKSSSNIIQNIKGKSSYSGKHPITGEKLCWEYVEEDN